MSLTRKAGITLAAFTAFYLLVATWLVYLYLLRQDVEAINQLRELGATRYPEPTAIAEFSLTTDQGDVFTERDLLGQWSLVFFGFTSCPDVCPLTMEELALFSRRYREQGQDDPPQVVFVSVDPERDGVAEVARYMNRFDDGFTGLLGTPDAIADLADNFYVHYGAGSDSADHSEHMNGADPARNTGLLSPVGENDVNLSHNAHLSLVNPDGQLHAVIRPPIFGENLLELYPQLIQGW